MSNDGIGQMGAGASDMRVAGADLQHNRTLDASNSHRVGVQERNSGGPMKQAIDKELAQHSESKVVRMKDLENHYKR